MEIAMSRRRILSTEIERVVQPEDRRELAAIKVAAQAKFDRFDRLIEDFRKMDGHLELTTKR